MADESGTLNTTLASLLTPIYQTLGRVEAGQIANRQTVLDSTAAIHRRMDDMHRELTGRMDRMEIGGRRHEPSVSWLLHLPWRIIIRVGGIVIAGLLVVTGHMRVEDLKALLH